MRVGRGLRYSLCEFIYEGHVLRCDKDCESPLCFASWLYPLFSLLVIPATSISLMNFSITTHYISCNFVLHGIVRSSCHRASLLGDKVKTGHGSRKFFITTYATGPPNDVKPRRSAVIATSQTEPYRSAACFFAAMDPAPFVHESGMLQSYHHAREERIP